MKKVNKRQFVMLFAAIVFLVGALAITVTSNSLSAQITASTFDISGIMFLVGAAIVDAIEERQHIHVNLTLLHAPPEFAVPDHWTEEQVEELRKFWTDKAKVN